MSGACCLHSRRRNTKCWLTSVKGPKYKWEYCIKMGHSKTECELEWTENPAAGCCNKDGEFLTMHFNFLTGWWLRASTSQVITSARHMGLVTRPLSRGSCHGSPWVRNSFWSYFMLCTFPCLTTTATLLRKPLRIYMAVPATRGMHRWCWSLVPSEIHCKLTHQVVYIMLLIVWLLGTDVSVDGRAESLMVMNVWAVTP